MNALFKTTQFQRKIKQRKFNSKTLFCLSHKNSLQCVVLKFRALSKKTRQQRVVPCHNSRVGFKVKRKSAALLQRFVLWNGMRVRGLCSVFGACGVPTWSHTALRMRPINKIEIETWKHNVSPQHLSRACRHRVANHREITYGEMLAVFLNEAGLGQRIVARMYMLPMWRLAYFEPSFAARSTCVFTSNSRRHGVRTQPRLQCCRKRFCPHMFLSRTCSVTRVEQLPNPLAWPELHMHSLRTKLKTGQVCCMPNPCCEKHRLGLEANAISSKS